MQLLILVAIVGFILIYFFLFKNKNKKEEIKMIKTSTAPIQQLPKIILSLNIFGVVCFVLPWINLPFVGSINAIKLMSDSFSVRVQEDTMEAVALLSIFFVISIVTSILQIRQGSISDLMKKMTIISGIVVSGIAVKTILEYNDIWSGPGDNIIGDTLAMSFSIGWGLYGIILAGIGQVIATLTVKK